jgi:hypothetical protein
VRGVYRKGTGIAALAAYMQAANKELEVWLQVGGAGGPDAWLMLPVCCLADAACVLLAVLTGSAALRWTSCGRWLDWLGWGWCR